MTISSAPSANPVRPSGARRLSAQGTAQPFAIAGLEGWTLSEGPVAAPAGSVGIWSDGLGTTLRRDPGDPDRMVLRAEDMGAALIDLGARHVVLEDLCGRGDLALQWAADQVAARLLGHLGRLVVHAGTVRADDGRAVLLMGPSGRGKSTLSAFLDSRGWPVMGDDSAVLDLGEGAVTARSVYPRLKLRRDSWRQLNPGAALPPVPPGAKVPVALGTDPADPAGLPVAAVILLGEDAPRCRIEPVAPPALCIELLRNTYTLDPVDRRRAAVRLRLSGEVAGRVPGLRLHYPRDFGRLPEVREALRGALSRLPARPRAAQAPCQDRPAP